MKKKIILALTACLFATVSIINMHLAQNNHNMDISLADISVMAQAGGEHDPCPGGSWEYECKWDGVSCGMISGCAMLCPGGC